MAYTTIDDPEAYFQVELWTGTGGSLSPTFDGDTDLQPDLIWLKDRDDTYNHFLFDSVRGALKEVRSNTTAAEATLANSVSAFNSDGFTLGTDANTNASGDKFVAWCWKAGTSFSNDASSTSVGTIDSAGSVNTDAGFSIVAYTGNGSTNQSVAHSLGVTPKIKIIKNRSADGPWTVSGALFEADNRCFLNTTAAVGSVSGYYPNDASTTFAVSGSNSGSGHNTNNENYIAYLFAEKKGYSKFARFHANGNANGTFVYTGFRPAFVIIKEISGTANWFIFDNKRLGYNGAVYRLKADTNEAGNTSNVMDLLSNGFKLRVADGDKNESGARYVCFAFAEQPFVTSKGVPANAR